MAGGRPGGARRHRGPRPPGLPSARGERPASRAVSPAPTRVLGLHPPAVRPAGRGVPGARGARASPHHADHRARCPDGRELSLARAALRRPGLRDHGPWNPSRMSEAEERRYLRGSLDAVARAAGARPRGWLGTGAWGVQAHAATPRRGGDPLRLRLGQRRAGPIPCGLRRASCSRSPSSSTSTTSSPSGTAGSPVDGYVRTIKQAFDRILSPTRRRPGGSSSSPSTPISWVSRSGLDSSTTPCATSGAGSGSGVPPRPDIVEWYAAEARRSVIEFAPPGGHGGNVGVASVVSPPPRPVVDSAFR